jgi:hypothetical protein
MVSRPYFASITKWLAVLLYLCRCQYPVKSWLFPFLGLITPPTRHSKTNHFIACRNLRASPNNACICFRSAIAPLVNRPCLRAFRFPRGAPDPGAPPCMRQRFLPRTAGERHAPPERVLAPHHGLASIARVLRAWSLMPVFSASRLRHRDHVRKSRASGPSAHPSLRAPGLCPKRSRSHAA